MVLKHFVQDEDKKAQALKRGGGSHILDLDGPGMPAKDLPAATVTANPDEAFDHGWRVTLLREAVECVRARFLSEGLSIKFRVFEEYDLIPEGARPTYADLATRLGIKASDVQNYLVLLRREVLAELRTHLGRMTASSDELHDEWQALFGS
jgi:RNA polymerase sigma-70 factor (ECF subfamily)